ncbi:hypothetical protein JKF63_03840 [Porcisia hertigi]|uniref:Cilia- and flagella-associated protein 300 n=1 Tax=Porcisia hertigi TaxID=2761500 RepID=A0A836IH88_9TRYP|nr:hypothetical protein JKF63_03840 [Porcisia hertigi]
MFVFQRAASPSPTTNVSACTSFIDGEPYKSLFLKWGFLRSGKWNVHSYRYTFTDEASPSPKGESASHPVASTSSSRNANTSVSAVSAVALRFHHGVAADFLSRLFASPCVRSDLVGDDANHAQAGTEDDRLQFRPLTCHWTTLTPLRQALVDAKVVRQVMCDAGGATVRDTNEPVYLLPTVKRAEEVLPHGEVLSDELRALFLRAHNRPGARASGDNGCLQGECHQNDFEVAAAAGEDDDDDDDTWGSMCGAKLPMRQLRSVFSEESRREFLYHIVWRLVAGSGPLNQFEDDAAVYLDAARELYRFLVRSVQAREVTEPGTDDDVTGIEAPTSTSARYKALVDASVYEVATAPGMVLFPRSDGVYPSNLNYCYVVVNPSEQTATVWYHRC